MTVDIEYFKKLDPKFYDRVQDGDFEPIREIMYCHQPYILWRAGDEYTVTGKYEAAWGDRYSYSEDEALMSFDKHDVYYDKLEDAIVAMDLLNRYYPYKRPIGACPGGDQFIVTTTVDSALYCTGYLVMLHWQAELEHNKMKGIRPVVVLPTYAV